MAQNQATGGNSMAATLGNLQNRTQRPGRQPGMPAANYGAGMQAPMQGQGKVWRGPAPIPPGGPGYPQMSPDAMQNMMGQISQLQQRPGGFNAPGQAGQPLPMAGQLGQQLQGGAPGNMATLGGALGNLTGQMPRRPMGAPGMGAGGGKNQQIAQLPGGPPMGR